MTQAYGIAVDADARVYVLRRTQPKLFRLDPDGMARTVAGTGQPGYSGDGGPAVSARLASPNHLAVAADGTIYIADSGNSVVRKVSGDGIITTVAGSGERGFGGDGGPALEARFDGLSAIALDAAGAIYVADFENDRIRKITAAGVVSTVAGTGESRRNGEGIAATAANIGQPTGVAVDDRGFLYIADQANNRIRLVTPDGILHTIAGTGRIGRPVDGAPAEESSIFIPDILCVGADGVVYFPDHQNNAVRKLVPITSE
jgi:sugar lactone lactonase YvrE